MTPAYTGQPLRRLEDVRFLTGQGRYVDDQAADLHLHAYVLRSPYSHARIRGVDTRAASALPGVAGVFTATDLHSDGIGTLPCVTKLSTGAPLVTPPRFALAGERARHVGDPVALIVATNLQLARDAAELIDVAYDVLPAVVDAAAALAPDAPSLWNEAPGNQAFHFEKGDRQAVTAAFAKAIHCISLELINNRVIPAPLEPRAAIGTHDPSSDTLHLLLTGQAVHGIRQQLAESVFHLPADRIQLTAPDVGGGFGAKNFLYPEWVLVLWAARRLGRPVRWVAERAEDFISTVHGRDNRTQARLGLDADGRFLALDVATIANMGAYLSGGGPGIPTNSASSAMGGPYDIPTIFMQVHGAFTNTVPVDAYRGAGKPEANYLIERLVDAAARKLGIDRVALRRQNLISHLPHRTAMGMLIDSGDFVANLDVAASQADWTGFEARRAAAAQRGRLRGVGVACYLETSRGAPGEMASVRVASDGAATLCIGTQSNGQGHETSYAQIAADHLGLPLHAFRVVQADTRQVATGSGHGGARSMHMGGTALVQAMDALIEKGKSVAARLLQVQPEQLHFTDGHYRLVGGGMVSLAAVARAGADDGASEAVADLMAEASNGNDLYTFPNGCHLVELEIDPETGEVTLERYLAVDDFGRLINPLLTEGQLQGGVAQGIGQALLEHTVYDAESGQMHSGSLLDYALPRASDLPRFELTFNEIPTKSNPLGVKGVGQAGCIAAPQAVMNAILDALSPLGITQLDMPATPCRIWESIRAGRLTVR